MNILRTSYPLKSWTLKLSRLISLPTASLSSWRTYIKPVSKLIRTHIQVGKLHIILSSIINLYKPHFSNYYLTSFSQRYPRYIWAGQICMILVQSINSSNFKIRVVNVVARDLCSDKPVLHATSCVSTQARPHTPLTAACILDPNPTSGLRSDAHGNGDGHTGQMDRWTDGQMDRWAGKDYKASKSNLCPLLHIFSGLIHLLFLQVITRKRSPLSYIPTKGSNILWEVTLTSLFKFQKGLSKLDFSREISNNWKFSRLQVLAGYL